jgi:molecular chaperone DnaK
MGVPQIEVTFNIDANGILNVSARDKGTGKEQKITIQSSGGLSKDEIERMRRDADEHASDDKAKREFAEARNKADQHVYQLEKLMEEHKDKLSDADKGVIQAAIGKVNEAKKGDDLAALQRAVEELQTASQRMAEHLYAASAQPTGPSADGGATTETAPGTGAGAKPDDVIDVEFEEKK